jgi:hypothetical protein
MYTTTIFLVYCKLDSCPFPLRKRKNKADFHYWKNDFAIIGGSFVFTVELLSENGIITRGKATRGICVSSQHEVHLRSCEQNSEILQFLR